MRLGLIALLLGLVSCGGERPGEVPPLGAGVMPDAGWGRFRGPNGSGVALDEQALPSRFDRDRNLVWRVPVPEGYSSPILSGDAVVLTAALGDQLLTFSLDRTTGEERWRRAVRAARAEELDTRNHRAAASPAVDADGNVFVFFGDFGLVSYGPEGTERWQLPLGPFENVYGMGASPIVAGDLVILACDQQRDSFLLAVDAATGDVRWRTPRPQARSGHSSPVLWRSPEGEHQVLVAGSFMLTAYAVETGERRWWVGGLPFEMKSTPVLDGDMLFVHGYASPLNQPGDQIEVAPWATTLAAHDRDGDRLISYDEFPDARSRGYIPYLDLDGDGLMNEEDWQYYRAAMASLNGMVAMRLGGAGEMTAQSVRWRYHRAVPQLPSPLLYQGVLYMINDGGIVTSFEPATGEVLARGRLRGAVDDYYASPVAADDKLFFVGVSGTVAVVEADDQLDQLTVNDLESPAYATPAIVDGRIYVRTVDALWAFGYQ